MCFIVLTEKKLKVLFSKERINYRYMSLLFIFICVISRVRTLLLFLTREAGWMWK